MAPQQSGWPIKKSLFSYHFFYVGRPLISTHSMVDRIISRKIVIGGSATTFSMLLWLA